MKPALEIKSISKKYAIQSNRARYRTLRDSLWGLFESRRAKREFWALDDISLDVLPGEKWGIVGGNGVGKTTLLKVIARITPPTKGSVMVRGQVASLLEVGTGFHPELSGRDNIFLNGTILGMSRRDIQRKFDQIVAFSDVETFLDSPLKHYSTGMWARLAFSVAAHLNPDILLIDEVLSVGDASFQKKSLGKMNEVSRQGRAILFVSHNMAAVRQLCDRCLWIEQGKIVQIGTPDEVIDAYLADTQTSSAGYVDLAGAADREGSRDAWLQRVELRNHAGETTGVYAIGDDLNIHLFIESVTAKKVKIIVCLKEANGERVCTIYDNDSGFSLANAVGSRHVSISLKNLRFCPGDYRIDIGLTSEMFNYTCDVYDDVESRVSFKIVNHSAMNRALKRSGGLLFLTPEWTEHR
jgi:lipopolysaccharide transport system ATP-binding protein